MAPSNRERRAAKQRRRDERRGSAPGRTATATDPGLPAETLQAVLRRAAADLAAGHEEAVTELRHVLAEHLARRRDRVLAACDVVLTGVSSVDTPLGAELARGGSASSWAERAGLRTEEVAVATIHTLALDLNQ